MPERSKDIALVKISFPIKLLSAGLLIGAMVAAVILRRRRY